MPEPFNPYQTWLGLPATATRPDYYQLLGIDDTEADVAMISAAADRALTKVRSFRPGAQAPQWAALLDELNAAKKCLTNPSARAAYEAQRQQGLPASAPVAPQTPVSPAPLAAPLSASLFPPGFAPSATSPSPPSPVAANPMAPNPMAPIQTAASPMAPWQIPAPTAAPNPMAPLGSLPTLSAPTPPNPMAPLVPGVAPSYPYPAPVAAPVAMPVAAGIPIGLAPMATPLARPVGAPMSGPLAPSFALAPPATPVELGPPLPPPAVTIDSALQPGQFLMPDESYGAAPDAPALRSMSSAAITKAVERQRSRWMLPVMLTVVSGAILVVLAIGVMLMKNDRQRVGDNATQVAQQEPPPKTEKKGRNARIVTRDDAGRDRETTKTDAGSNESPKPNSPPKNNTDSPNTSEKPSEPNPDSPPSPDPKPDNPPEPKPDPTPEPKPTTKPDPKPEPIPPGKPAVSATRTEVQQLAKALQAARTAMSEQEYELAAAELAKAEDLAKLPEHVAKLERLKQLLHYLKEFRRALAQAVKDLKGGDAITVGSTVVGVVEIMPSQEKMILRVAGTNRTYRYQDLPLGLAVGIADRWLDKKAAGSLVAKGAYVIIHKNASDDNRAKGKSWWEEARGAAPEVINQLLPVIDDKYDKMDRDPGVL